MENNKYNWDEFDEEIRYLELEREGIILDEVKKINPKPKKRMSKVEANFDLMCEEFQKVNCFGSK